MYLPRQFEAQEASIATDLIRAHPFASLISVDDEGLPFVTHLPLHLEQRGRRSGAARPLRQGQSARALPAGAAAGRGHVPRSPCLYVAPGVPGPGPRADLELPRGALHGAGDPDRRTRRQGCAAQEAHRRPRAGLCGAVALAGRGLRPQDAGGHRGVRAGGDAGAVQDQAEPAPPRSPTPPCARPMRGGGEDEQALGRWMDRLGMPKQAQEGGLS